MFPVGFVLISDLVSRGIGFVVKNTADVVGKDLEAEGSRCRKKRRTSGVIIWMGYSEDRSGSHDFSGGGRRGCQDLIWGTGERLPVRLLVT